MKMQEIVKAAKQLAEPPEELWSKIREKLEGTVEITLRQKDIDKLTIGESVTVGQVTVHSSAVIDRFWGKVDKQGPLPRAYAVTIHPDIAGIPCWVWTAGIRDSSEGYGQFSVDRQCFTTHRYVWFLTYGRWPAQHILHKCDNRACVNPLHLFEGTFEDNNRDASAKGRYRKAGENNGQAKLTYKQVEQIRELSSQGVPYSKLSLQFGVSKGNISSIVKRRIWTRGPNEEQRIAPLPTRVPR